MTMRRPLLALCGAGLLAACGPAPRPDARDGWVQLPAVPGRPAAAYLTLAGGAGEDVLVGVEVPAAERAEIHRSMTHGHMATMAPVDALPVPAGADIALAPGGMHVMIFGLPATVTPGSAVELRLRFEQAGTVAATLPARAAGDGPPAAP